MTLRAAGQEHPASHDTGRVARVAREGDIAMTVIRSPYPDVAIPEVPLTDYVLEAAGEHPDKPALIDGPSGRTLTFGQLVAGVRRVAAGLAARGFGKGDVFAIYCPNLPEYGLAFFGV